MVSSQWTTTSTGDFSECVDRIADAISGADAVLVGAGAGLSTAAGFSYAGKRCDDTFVEDANWHAAARRYDEFLNRHRRDRIVLLEVGVGGNTPAIIKYPFWRMASENRNATYVQLNKGEVLVPSQLERQSVILDCDAAEALSALRERLG